MKWRIRKGRLGWHAEKGMEVDGNTKCPWKAGYFMPGFVVYESSRFDTKEQAERYIKRQGGTIEAVEVIA